MRSKNWFKEKSLIEPNLLNYLDLVSLGTVCDVVPLIGLNRAIVKQGLKIIKSKKNLGIKTLFLSNASGGVNPKYKVGDLMILNDHINLIPNPLIGKNIDQLGPRFPDMSEPYCKELIKKAEKISLSNNIDLHKGVYVALTGPTLETPAEYNYMRIIGGDTVGMSTAPEVVVARHMNIKCFAISVITDLGIPGKIKKVSHKEIQKIAEATEPKLTTIIKEVIKSI